MKMIASVRGTLLAVELDHLVVEVGGVGLQVFAARNVLAAAGPLGEPIFLQTVLIVREDALTLYGFTSDDQRRLFHQLLAVSGVGPRVALNLIGSAAPGDLRLMIAQGDLTQLARVPGIGKKTAERIVLELKGKIDLRGTPAATVAAAAAPSVDRELLDLLVSLGYSATEAAQAVNALPADAPTELEARLRLALRTFGTV
jgi:holliday junction DNA helicase RuvA